MGHRREMHKEIGTKIRDFLCDQLEAAVNELNDATGASRSGAVHNVRRRLKKVRATLHLLHFSAVHGISDVDEKLLGFAAREMAGVRDADANMRTARDVCRHFDVEHFLFPRLFQILDREQSRAAAEAGESTHNAALLLKSVHDKVEQWKGSKLKWRDFQTGLERVYQRGRSAWKKAAEESTAENMHRWRKRTHDLLHNLVLLQAIDPHAAHKPAQAAKKLVTLLGDDHDVVMLHRRVDQSHIGIEKDGMEELIGQRRQKLQKKALKLGAKLFDRKPRAFLEKILT